MSKLSRWLLGLSIPALLFSSSSAFAGKAYPKQDLSEALRRPTYPVGCLLYYSISEKAGCDSVRSLLIQARQLRIKKEKEFFAIIKARLSEIQGAETYNYGAVLLATLSEDERFLEPLRKVSAIERRDRLFAEHASRAVERLASGSCKGKVEPIYGEICDLRDPVLHKMHLFGKWRPK